MAEGIDKENDNRVNFGAVPPPRLGRDKKPLSTLRLELMRRQSGDRTWRWLYTDASRSQLADCHLITACKALYLQRVHGVNVLDCMKSPTIGIVEPINAIR